MEVFTIDRHAMKLDARAAMREHRPSVYMVAFAFLLITMVLEMLSTKLQFPGMRFSDILRYAYDEDGAIRLWYAVSRRSGASRLLDFAITVMNVMLTGGFALFCLNVSRRRAAAVGTLFDPFGYFFRFLWLEFVTGVFIFLWSLLLIVPGIVAAYRYSMARYIFFDDPDKGALDCIRESKEMTMGFKGRLFVLDLSFIGWAILSVVPFVGLFTQPYIGITKANYYRALSARMSSGPQQGCYRDPWNQ